MSKYPGLRRKPAEGDSPRRRGPDTRGTPGRRPQPPRRRINERELTPGADPIRRRRALERVNKTAPFGRKVAKFATGFDRLYDSAVPKWKGLPWQIAIEQGLDWWHYFRNPVHPGVPNLPDPGRWALKHGLNSPEAYYASGYWNANNRGIYASNMAYGSTGTGPGTGLIAGQSVTVTGPAPGQLIGTGTNFGWWILHQAPLNRYAQYAAFIKRSTVQNPDYRTQLMEQLGPVHLVIPPNVPFPPAPYITGQPGIKPTVEPWTNPFGAQPFDRLKPGISYEIGQGWNLRPRAHARRRPPRRTKEAKTKLAKFAQFIGNVLGGWTEANDFMTALHKALPEELQVKKYYKGKRIKPGWKDVWNTVYQHFDKINWKKAAYEVGMNQLEDYIIGKMSKQADKNLLPRPSGGAMPSRVANISGGS